jgi:membrane dipeptidase
LNFIAVAVAPPWVGYVLIGVASLVIILAINFFGIAPIVAARRLNGVKLQPPYHVGDEAHRIHKSLFIADLHADPLLWSRNLLDRSNYGHIDLPRLIEGNIGFQVFGLVTSVPMSLNLEENSGNALDLITLLSIAQSWPMRTWGNLLQRALFMAKKLQTLAARSQGRLMLVENQEDLEKFLELRRKNPHLIGGFACVEGVHAFEGKLENLDLLYDTGVRMVGLTHLFDNEAGGSAYGIVKGGLTSFGRQVVERAQEKHMLVDLAHASPQVIGDVLEMSFTAVICSHTGVRGTCDNVRNLSDEHLQGIARSGGVVGIALFKQAVCDTTIKGAARAMRYTADLVGVEHIALGTDFDGAIAAPVDCTGLVLLTEALLQQGFSEQEISLIMGNNFLRVLKTALPVSGL